MANQQNKVSQNPSSTGEFGGGENIGNQNPSAAQPKKENSIPNIIPKTVAKPPQQPTASGTLGTTESFGETGKSLLDQAKDTAGLAYDAAAEQATTTFDEKKASLWGGLASVADSVRKVGENLQGADSKDGIGTITAEYSSMAAQKIDRVANYFESKDVRAMYQDVEHFARKNPAIFIGGAFAFGILAARFIKSSSSNQLNRSAGQRVDSKRSYNEDFRSGETKPSVGA